MTKTVWIVNQYASTPDTGMGGRHFYLARELVKQGYKVYLIAESNHHLLRDPPAVEGAFKFNLVDGFTFVWVKMPTYKEAHSRRRVINWFLFSWNIRRLSKLIPDPPDAVLCSSPSPIVFLGAQRLAKRFKARLVFEVRDIWPLTLTEIGGYSPRHPFIRFMQWVEDKAYQDSDAVVSNLKNAVEHMVNRGMARSKFTWVPNGFSLDEVSQKAPLNEWAASQLPKNKFIIGYAGTLGVANALGTLVEAAEELREYADIAFVIVGGGKEKPILQASVKSRNLDNVIFVDPIPKLEIQAMLSQFDICYIGWIDDDLYRFGIGANKIPEYLYASKPVIHGYSGACDPVKEYNAGVCIKPQDSKALANAVLKIYGMPQEQRQQLGSNGRQAAVEYYEYGRLAKKLEKVLLGN